MLKQSIGMTENNAKQIAEMYLSRYNPTYWDGSGKVPSEVIFEICRVAVDSMYNGCTLDIQLCKIDACPCYAASIHLFEGGFWTGHGIGCFDKTALCYDIGSVHSLASAIMRICATYENLTNFRKVFVERLVISKERMNEIKQYTDGGKKQDEIEFESVTFADGMCMDVRCVPRKDGPSWCEAAIYYADEDVVTSEPYNSFYNHWVCQTASALHPNLKTLWSSWKTLSFPTTNRSLMWLQAVWKLWGFQSRRVISTRMTSPPSMFPSNLSAFITSF